MAVASVEDASPNVEKQRDQSVSGYLLYEISTWVCHQRAKGGCSISVREPSAVSGQVRREPADLAAANRLLQRRECRVPLSLASHGASGARTAQCLHLYWPHDSARVSQRLQTHSLLWGAGNQDIPK